MADKAEVEVKEVQAEKKDDAPTDKPTEVSEEASKAAEEKKSEDVEMKEEEKEPAEKEVDAPADSRAKVSKVELNLQDCTLNVLPTAGGRLVTALSEGGMQLLQASVRANVGVKAGRYMFEARIVENLAQTQGGPGPKQIVRLGFSTAGSSLFLGDGPDNFCFDLDAGFFLSDKTRTKCGQKVIRDQIAAVVLNLDPSTPNSNTVSLFVNGVRRSPPQPLPESLVGKTLFPTVTYKNATLEVNFGPASRAPLPFTCRMMSDAAAADSEQVAASTKKNQVVFPVGLPEQGYFDWVDEFCEKNPGFTELSDRKILEWAAKSGIAKAKTPGSGSNDKPDTKLGVPALDDWSVRKILASVAPVLGRNYVVPELKSNLIAGEREKALKAFMSNDFERKAVVVMGEPSSSSKQRVQELLIKDKKEKASIEKLRKAAEEERKRILEEKKAKIEEAKKARLAVALKKAGKEEEAPADPKEEEKKEEDVKMEEPEKEPELTEEEKKLWYRKTLLPDITEPVLTKSYATFTLPTKEEGFDAIDYEWQSEQACVSLLKSWILEKKLTSRAEDLTPGTEFKETWAKWQKTLQEWRLRQAEFKNPTKRKALQAKKVEAAKKAVAEEKKALMEAGNEEGAKELEEKAVKDAEPKEVDMEDLDIFGVEDVLDVGGSGEPLFSKFAFEDWTLLTLRCELHLMVYSFKKDLNDPDRPGFGEKHFAYYYNKYFKKAWNQAMFGVKTLGEVLGFIKTTVKMGEAGFLQAEQAEDTPLETFVKLVEDHRRERERRVDAGDETAKLKFLSTQVSVPTAGGAQKRVYSPAPPNYAPNKIQVRPAAYGGNFPGAGYGAYKR